MIPVFITGTGTGIGKTVVSSIVSHALNADYWKPIQAGDTDGTDSNFVNSFMPEGCKCMPEVYRLLMPASPHIAARAENTRIELDEIYDHFLKIVNRHAASDYLVIEGAGGLLVPLNENEFVADLILKLGAKVILVSRNYLGSINHSLLTARVCRLMGIDVLGWIFNDDYMSYQHEIAGWSGYEVIGSIPKLETINQHVVREQAMLIRKNLLLSLEKRML